MLILHEVRRSSVAWVVIEEDVQLPLLSFIVVLVGLSLPGILLKYLLNILNSLMVELNKTGWILVCVDNIRSFLVKLVLFSFVGVLDCLRLFLEVFQLALDGSVWLVSL